MSGDTIVVGAPQENSGDPGDEGDNSALYAGATYVFVRVGTTWVQQAYLKSSQAPQTASFGKSVAISGDTIVVGAPFESSGATGINGDESDLAAAHSGAAFVFIRSGTSWTQQAYLKASNTETSDAFGSSVAIDGDAIVVGAPLEDSAATGFDGDQSDNSAENSGAVYVYSRSGTTWTQQRYLKASNSDESDLFGSAVAISGDTIVVGAPGEASASAGVGGNQNSNAVEDSGAVYVFRLIGASAWVQQAYLKASNPDGDVGLFSRGDEFGSSVSLSGDLLAVGAPNESSAATGIGGDQNDNSAEDAGAVYIFSRSGTTWSQEAYVKASNTRSDDEFGTAVSLSGSTLVVGAPFEDGISTGIDGDDTNDQAYDAGACYVFAKPAAAWIQSHYLKPSYLADVPVEATDDGLTDLFGDLFGGSGSSSDLHQQQRPERRPIHDRTSERGRLPEQ